MNELIIDRTKWCRGHNTARFGYTSLLNDLGCMCCLGFDSIRCGIENHRLKNRGLPPTIADLTKDEMKEKVSHLVRTSIYGHFICTEFATYAASINDESGISEELRERTLIDIFSKENIKLTFIN